MTRHTEAIYWSAMVEEGIQLYLAASDKGLCFVTLPSESLDTLREWVNAHIPSHSLREDGRQLEPYADQIAEYFRRERQAFTIPLDLRGTTFQRSVWIALTRIPYGQLRSYTDIAQDIQNPKAVRAVGAANGRNPLPIVVPCHRVVGKDGGLTGFRGGLRFKERLLSMEGVLNYRRTGHSRFDF